MFNCNNNNIIEPRLTDLMIRGENLPVNLDQIINHVTIRFIMGCMRFDNFDILMGKYDGGEFITKGITFVSDHRGMAQRLYEFMEILDQAQIRFGVVAGYQNCSIDCIVVDFSRSEIKTPDELRNFIQLTNPPLWDKIMGWVL